MDQVVVAEAVYRPRPGDLPAFLPYACGQLEAPFRVTTLLQHIEEYGSKSDDRSKKSKRDKTTAQLQTSTSQYSNERRESGAVVTRNYGDEDEVVIRMFCDSADKPLELMFYRCTQVPRLLMKILGLCIPFHPQLSKITIRWGFLDGPVLYEIAKFLPLSQITEICLDDSPVLHRNYFLLLEQQTHLRSLSLARCDLLDEDIAKIAAKLVHPLPASRTLAILSLESNKITDDGARYLGEMLRTNRSLRHLNLAGNRLTNLGATCLFRPLVQFPVSFDEIAARRKRTFEYLKEKQATYERCLATLATLAVAAPPDPPQADERGRRRTAPVRCRKPSAATLASTNSCAADAMAGELLGPLCEPFDSRQIITRDGMTYCVGNFSLSYLNLAYNDVDCGCVARLAEVLAYQAARRACEGGGWGGGLVRAVLEGSRGAAGEGEAGAAAAALERAVVAVVEPIQLKSVARKSERIKIKSS